MITPATRWSITTRSRPSAKHFIAIGPRILFQRVSPGRGSRDETRCAIEIGGNEWTIWLLSRLRIHGSRR